MSLLGYRLEHEYIGFGLINTDFQSVSFVFHPQWIVHYLSQILKVLELPTNTILPNSFFPQIYHYLIACAFHYYRNGNYKAMEEIFKQMKTWRVNKKVQAWYLQDKQNQLQIQVYIPRYLKCIQSFGLDPYTLEFLLRHVFCLLLNEKKDPDSIQWQEWEATLDIHWLSRLFSGTGFFGYCAGFKRSPESLLCFFASRIVWIQPDPSLLFLCFPYCFFVMSLGPYLIQSINFMFNVMTRHMLITMSKS
jgi:hypothetical protein